MANISVKDVPDQWAEALRQRAARNHRSLQGELMFLIEQAVRGGDIGAPNPDSPAGRAGRVVGFDRRGEPTIRQGWKTVEQVVAELNAKYPGPVTDAPLGVDIIRADRDSR
jgi:plasmid stability protein